MFKIRFNPVAFWPLAGLSVLLQASVVHSVSIGGVVPDLVLLCVIFYALYQGAGRGLAAGMALGCLTDLLSAGIMGMNTLILGCIGAGTGLLRERVYTTHPLTRLLVAAVAGLLHNLLYYILAGNFHRLPQWHDSAGLMWGSVLYTSVANLAIAAFLERFTVKKVFTLT